MIKVIIKDTRLTFGQKIGMRGKDGIQGVQGLQGEKGDKGDKGDDAILPPNIVIDPNYVHTDNNFTTLLKNAYDSAVTWISTNGTTLLAHLGLTNNPHNVTKTQVGLGNVDNTSDLNKPISNDTQTALDLKVDEVAGKSLVLDTEIAKLADYPNKPAVPQRYVLYDDMTFGEVAVGSGGAAVNVYLTNINSPVAGYKKSSAIAESSTTLKTISAVTNNVIAWGEKYLFEAPVATTQIQAGFWYAHLYGKVNNTAGITKAVVRIFKVDTLGVETEIVAPFYSEEINFTTDNSQIQFEIYSELINLLATDTVGFQIGVITDNVNPTKTLTYSVGDGFASHFNTPLSMRHSGTRDKNGELAFQHVDASTTKTALVAADKMVIFDSETNTAKLADRKAANIPFTPAGNIEATNVDGALKELDNKKADKSKSNTFTGIQTLTDGTKLTKIVPIADSSGVVIKDSTDTFNRYAFSRNTFQFRAENSLPTFELLNVGNNNGFSIKINGTSQEEASFGEFAANGYYVFTNNNRANELMRLTADKRLGIATPSPETTLDVKGTTTLRDWTYLNNGTHTGDAIGDRRTKVVNDVEVTERCTVANATKGAGTWVKSSNQLFDNTDAANASNVGCQRYRDDGNNSYIEVCMRTGASTYAWVIIIQNNW